MTRWQPSSIRQLPLYCNRQHGLRRGRNSKRRPFLGLHPGVAVPPSVSANRNSSADMPLALGSRGCAVADSWGALALSIERAARLSSLPIQLRSDFTRLRALPPNTLTSSYYYRNSNKHAEKTKFSGSEVQRNGCFAFVLLRMMQTGEEPVKVSLQLASLDL